MSRNYIIKRLIWFLAIAFFAITINFFLPRLIPGDPYLSLLNDMRRKGQALNIEDFMKHINNYRIRFGLDKDLPTQYFMYLQQLFQGDIGVSLMAFPAPVITLILRVLPWSLGLLFNVTIISWTLGVVLGSLVALRRESKILNFFHFISLGLVQIPYYIIALILVSLLAYVIPLFPSSGGYSIGMMPGLNLSFIADVLYHSFLPALSLIIVSVGGWMIEMRGVTTTILGEDYILYAEATGLKKRTILIRYAFRNALLPEITRLAMSLGGIVGGALLLEIIFSYPGMGQLLLFAMNHMDYNIMQGVFLFSTLSTLVAVLLIDLLYPLVDPRVGVGYER
jgi:peptide/nickel transport system permease protein